MASNWKHVVLTLTILAALAAPSARAQSLTISLSSHAVNFALTRGSANNLGSNPVSVTTNWVLGNRNMTLTVYSYFANAATALTGPGGNIPSSALSISVNGTAFRALTFTEVFGGANAGRHVVVGIPITGTGTRTDSIIFNLDLSTGTLPQLPAGTYTGTLSIQAQAV
jgi:hypothetical protein